MYKKSLYKHIEFYMHNNSFPCNNWNTIQVFSISTQCIAKQCMLKSYNVTSLIKRCYICSRQTDN